MRFSLTYFCLAITFLIPMGSLSQEIKKEKIYLMFKLNDGTDHPALGKKFKNEEGINFNLYKHYFTHKKEHTRDTLPVSQLNDFKITQENELKEKEKNWWKKNLGKLKNKYSESGLIPPFNKNGVFAPYIIEKINNRCIVVYQVEFRNEGVIP